MSLMLPGELPTLLRPPMASPMGMGTPFLKNQVSVAAIGAVSRPS